ncbi:MAG: class I SAM-dependent methyltransferase [Candidatus Krumholzibacteriia bacterium]
MTLEPLPSDADLARLYGDAYFESGLHGLDQLGQSYEEWADGAMDVSRRFLRDELLARRPGARSVFEIGAAMGHFLEAARQEGLAVAGLEISPAATARAREKFGLELVCANVEAFDPGPCRGRWDLVYAGDLFEHLRDPSGVLAKVAELLSPGGLFFIRVPSTLNLLSTRLASPLLRATRRSRLLPDPPYHLYEYTPATIGRLFARHFARVEIRQEALAPRRLNLKGGSPAYRAKRALQVVNAPLTRLTGRFGDRLTVCGWKAG